MKGQAFIAVNVIMRTHELIPGTADENRPRHELERPATVLVAERTPAHERDRVLCVALNERPVSRTGRTSTVEYRDRAVLQWCCYQH